MYHDYELLRRATFNIGKPPIFDPCKACILQNNCNELCLDKARFDINQDNKNKPTTIKVSRRGSGYRRKI